MKSEDKVFDKMGKLCDKYNELLADTSKNTITLTWFEVFEMADLTDDLRGEIFALTQYIESDIMRTKFETLEQIVKDRVG